MTADEFFYVYGISYDQEVFGLFSTEKAAEKSLAEQIANGGPAWVDCVVKRWKVLGKPENDQRARMDRLWEALQRPYGVFRTP